MYFNLEKPNSIWKNYACLAGEDPKRSSAETYLLQVNRFGFWRRFLFGSTRFSFLRFTRFTNRPSGAGAAMITDQFLPRCDVIAYRFFFPIVNLQFDDSYRWRNSGPRPFPTLNTFWKSVGTIISEPEGFVRFVLLLFFLGRWEPAGVWMSRFGLARSLKLSFFAWISGKFY